MATPTVYSFPTRRPGFIETATWIGSDDDLELQLGYTDSGGVSRVMKLRTSNTNESRVGDCCLDNTYNVDDLDRDLIVSHVRMATFISKTVAGSAEWQTSFVEQEGSADFQLPVGTAAVTAVRMITDVTVEFDIKKKGGGNPTRTIITDHSEVSNYSFTPSTQLLIIGGAMKLEFPNAVHDYPAQILTTQEKNDIADWVVTLDPWV